MHFYRIPSSRSAPRVFGVTSQIQRQLAANNLSLRDALAWAVKKMVLRLNLRCASFLPFWWAGDLRDGRDARRVEDGQYTTASGL